MEVHPHAEVNQEDISRRGLLKKAAYTAPAVFAIAAAPRTALGHSGPRGRKDNRKPKKDKGKPKKKH